MFIRLAKFAMLLGTASVIYGAGTVEAGGLPNGWVRVEIEKVAPNEIFHYRPVLCGPSRILNVLPNKLRPQISVIDVNRKTSTLISVNEPTWYIRCTEDGRYAFLERSSILGKSRAYSLSYVDLDTSQEHSIFSMQRFPNILNMNPDQLVSPNADAILGPNDVGREIPLTDGRKIKVIPFESFKNVSDQCGPIWSTDGSKLVLVSGSEPIMIEDTKKWKITYRWLDVTTGQWDKATTDHTSGISPYDCPDVFMLQERFFLKYRPIGPDTALINVFEYFRNGGRLNLKQSWAGISDFALGRDGTVVFSRLDGLQYFWDGYQLSSGGNLRYTVYEEHNGQRNEFFKQEIPDVLKMAGIKFSLSNLQVGVEVVSINGPIVIIDEFQQNHAYKVSIFVKAPSVND